MYPQQDKGWLGSYFESLSECLSLSPSFFILKILPSSVGLGLTFFGESIIRKYKNTKLTDKENPLKHIVMVDRYSLLLNQGLFSCENTRFAHFFLN